MNNSFYNDDRPKEKVLFVHNFYQIGGGEHTVFANEVKLLRDHDHEVFEYTRSNDELKESKLKLLLSPFSTIWSFKTYRDVSRIIKEYKIDIVHCHNTFPLISPSVYYAARRCGIPVIQTIHNFRLICPNGVLYRNENTCEDCLKKNLLFSIKHRCYRESKVQTMIVVFMLWFHRIINTYSIPHYIFLTEFNKGKFRKLLGASLDSQFIKPNFEYIKLPENKKERNGSFVFVGRLEKNKGIDFLVDNWETDKDLYIFGDGAMEGYIKSSCEKNNTLHYMGFQPQEVIWTYLGKATAMIFPTDLYEGFPMTIIEAFALGTPVACTNIGNGADIVKKDKAGVLFTKRSKTSLMKALQDIEYNFNLYSANAREAFINNYLPEGNYRQLSEIYKAVLK